MINCAWPIFHYRYHQRYAHQGVGGVNYPIITFTITVVGEGTQLTLRIDNFPTEIIRKHLEFYWRTTAVKIKKWVEAL
jgi:hypothetical protein